MGDTHFASFLLLASPGPCSTPSPVSGVTFQPKPDFDLWMKGYMVQSSSPRCYPHCFPVCFRDELYCCHRKWMLDYRHGSSDSRRSCRKKKGSSRMLLNPKRLYFRTHNQVNKKVTPVPLQKKNRSAATSTPLPYMSFLTCICSSLIDTVKLFTREVVPI